MASRGRPLSPHLQIYRLPMLALLSITHRGTGFLLSVGALLLPLVLFALADGEDSYLKVQALLAAWYGQALLFLISASLMFHLLNGIRHLAWDFGFNLEVKSAEFSGLLVIVLTLVLTAAIWLLVYTYYCGGAV